MGRSVSWGQRSRSGDIWQSAVRCTGTSTAVAVRLNTFVFFMKPKLASPRYRTYFSRRKDRIYIRLNKIFVRDKRKREKKKTPSRLIVQTVFRNYHIKTIINEKLTSQTCYAPRGCRWWKVRKVLACRADYVYIRNATIPIDYFKINKRRVKN